MVIQAQIPKLRILGQSRGCMATIRSLSSSMHSPPAESPWVGRHFESIRINRGEKDEHWRHVSSSLRVLNRFSPERATRSPFPPFVICVVYKMSQKRLFLQLESYLLSYRKESWLFRGSLSCQRSEFENLGQNTNELNESYVPMLSSIWKEFQIKDQSSECLNKTWEMMQKRIISAIS